MNTIIIEHADDQITALFKQMAKVVGVPLKTKQEKVLNTITNPEIQKRIEEYEKGKLKSLKFTTEELKAEFDRIMANA